MGSPTLPGQQPHRKHRIKLPASILCFVGIVVYAQFIILPQLISRPSASVLELSELHLRRLDADLQTCARLNTPPIEYEFPISSSRANPRWNPSSGQKETVILRNATLFDGEGFVPAVDIQFSKGVVVSVSPTSARSVPGARVVELGGKYVTPGLVDMHSHHLVWSWPELTQADDTNEVNPATGPLTPFVRSLDGMKADDIGTALIASGGVTSSLVLPGSANIMGGEAFMVKNAPKSGDSGEERVEDLLLEHGIPQADRRRYMKMACGENPKRVYKHTRMGNAWIFRHHMERARELLEKQDEWCLSATVARDNGDAAAIAALSANGGLPEELELESSVAILRGQVGVNVHCYEPEDIEDMLLHSKEFNFRIQAFHHALSAWKVPELIKESEENITVATFANSGLYKKEAYNSNLWAGKILSDHGVPVAYKSDHTGQEMNAQYLLFQAATAHSFHLPEDLALQSVTSVPAKSLGMDHRIGYVRAGYDADIVVFDSHPLSIGATPLQVYIDGRATLDDETVKDSSAPALLQSEQKPKMRTKLEASVREETCRQMAHGKTVITGITRSYLDEGQSSTGNLTLVLNKGEVICLNSPANCMTQSSGGVVIELEDVQVLPGLTAAFTNVGLIEIAGDSRTGDGATDAKLNPLDPENVVYAKHGVHLDGRAFERARIGGVTRIISTPLGGGYLGGVSVGIQTSGNKTILDGGIFQDDVALHFRVGQGSKGGSTPTISSAVSTLRRILSEGQGTDSVYGRASNGSLPVVVHAENKDDILQLVKLKESFPAVNLVIYGAAESPVIASSLANASIPVILTPRSVPDTFDKRLTPPGPPLSRSAPAVLLAAGVTLALGSPGDNALHTLPVESTWAGKHAGLTPLPALSLVSRALESILRLPPSRDRVLWSGDSVALILDQDNKIVACWPESE